MQTLVVENNMEYDSAGDGQHAWARGKIYSIKYFSRRCGVRIKHDKTNIGRNKPGTARSPEFICHLGLGVKLVPS